MIQNLLCQPVPSAWFGVPVIVPPPSGNISLVASDADVPFAGSDSAGDLTGSD